MNMSRFFDQLVGYRRGDELTPYEANEIVQVWVAAGGGQNMPESVRYALSVLDNHFRG